MEWNHERVWGKIRGLKSESSIERCGAISEGIDGDRAYGELAGGAQNTLQCVQQKTAADASALMGCGDRETGKERDGDREVPRESPANADGCLIMLDLRGDERVVAGDFAVRFCRYEGAGSVATLALAGIGKQPAIQSLLAAAECLDAVSFTIERGGRGEGRRHAAGRTLGFSVSRRRPCSASGEGCSSAARNRCAASSSMT